MTSALLLTAILLSLAPLEQCQAQLFIDVYPSQDNYKNQTLWVFSGDSQASLSLTGLGPYIRHNALAGTASSNERDTYALQDLLFPGTRDGGFPFSIPQLYTLSSLATSSLDYAGVTNFWASTNTVSSLSTAAGTPNLSFSNRVANGVVTNRSISHLFLYAQPGGDDWVGPRVSGGSNLTYGTNRPAVNWVGAGLIDKSISDFLSRDPYIRNKANALGYFGASGLGNGLRIRVHSSTVPEPEEYALVFGLFALGFVIFRRRFPDFFRKKI